MITTWHDVQRFAVVSATEDLDQRGEVHPVLLAFTGDDLSFLAYLRWFPKGAYHDPMIEVLSLASALGADRLAFATGGRLTSLDDPIPPVTVDGDLRQRALVVECVDGHDGPSSRHSTIHPFALVGGQVVWEDPVHLTDGQGWIALAMEAMVEHRGELAALATNEDARAQALRCVALGHELHLGPCARARLDLADRPAAR